MPKTWKEKLNSGKEPIVKRIDKKFADIPADSNMLIATPEIYDAYIREIPTGSTVDLPIIRQDLANEYNAEYTCPVTTGIFIRIVSEAAWDELESGASIESIAPFWRAVHPKSNLAKKLRCGVDWIERQRNQEE